MNNGIVQQITHPMRILDIRKKVRVAKNSVLKTQDLKIIKTELNLSVNFP